MSKKLLISAHNKVMNIKYDKTYNGKTKLKIAAAAVLFIVTAVFSGVVLTETANTAYAEQPEVGLIAKFSTWYGDSKQNRKDNVALACRKIDGLVLAPEEEFSFNGAVGKRSAANGFKTAYIIRDGEFVEGTGGGVCQVSTTIYNCALLSNLTITQVLPHSLPVAYVSPSFDAMVSSLSDLRFVNTLSAPVTIRMIADGRTVTAEIYGVKEAVVRRRSETLGSIPFETTYKDDESLAVGEEVVDTYGKCGLKSVGYLDYYVNGKAVKSVQIRRDSYMPQKQIILKGKKI